MEVIMSERTHPPSVAVHVEPIGDGEGATIRARIGGTVYEVDLTEEVAELRAVSLEDGVVTEARVDLRPCEVVTLPSSPPAFLFGEVA
jgi:hypothetical protein